MCHLILFLIGTCVVWICSEQAEELRALKLKNESLQQLAQLAQTGSVDLERWVISSHEFDKMIKFELQGRYLNLVTAYRAEKEVRVSARLAPIIS